MQIFLRFLLAVLTPASASDAAAEELQRATSVVLHHVYEAGALHDAALTLPDVTSPDLADQLVDAALELQTHRVPAALIIALSWGESRFEPDAQPACGVMQVYPHDLGEPQAACAEWRRDLRAGVRAGVREIEMMLADNRVGGDMRRALLYRACGNKAFDGSCDAKKYVWVTAAVARWRGLAAKARHALVPES
jgi:hypothetical protein